MILALVLLASAASAEGLKPDGLSRIAQDRGFDAAAFVQRLLSGESLVSLIRIDEIPGIVKRSILRGLSGLTLNLALPVAACVLLRMMTGAGDAGFMMNLLCTLCCGKALAQTWMEAQSRVSALIESLLGATEAMTPVMASAAALTGGAFWSTAIGPLSNLCASVIQRLLLDWGLRLVTVAAVVALSGAVSGRYALNRLFKLIRSAVHWLLGVAVFLFGGLLSAQGIVGAAKDGAAAQTAKIAMENLIPIIGSGISETAGSLAVSAGLARSAVGITGVALIIRLCARPMLKLGGEMLALKLVSAAMEPLSEGPTAELIGHYGEILEMLLAIAVCSAILAAMIPAGFAALSGGQ